MSAVKLDDRPSHLKHRGQDRTICGLKSPNDLPYCLVEFAEVHRRNITSFCEECWQAADTDAVGSPS